MQRQHGTARTSLRISSTMSTSSFFHFSSSSSYLLRVYSWLAALAFVKSASRSALNTFDVSAAAISAACFAIRSSRPLQVGSVPEFGGHLQHGSGSGQSSPSLGGCGCGAGFSVEGGHQSWPDFL